MSERTLWRDRIPVHRVVPERFLREYDMAGLLLVGPVILAFVLVSVIPIAYGIWLSFQTGTGAVNLHFVGITNYIELLGEQEFRMSVFRGLVFTVYSLTLQLVLGIIIALALNHWSFFQNLTRAIVFLPYMIPTVAVATIFAWLLNAQVGVINYILLNLGLIQETMSFFTGGLAMHTVVWASTWKWTVFVILIVLARLQSIEQTLYEAAKVNGAGTIQQFVDVTYPNIKSVLFLLVLLRSIWQFSKFEMIWLLTQGGPFNQTTTMVVYAYEKFSQLAYGKAAAVTTVVFLFLGVFALIYFSVFTPEDEVEVAQ